MRWGKPSHWRERRAARYPRVESAPLPALPEQPRLHLDIERLTLSGVQRRDASSVAQAVQAELTRLAARAASAPQNADRVSAGKIALGPTPERTGRAIAAAVHKALWR